MSAPNTESIVKDLETELSILKAEVTGLRTLIEPVLLPIGNSSEDSDKEGVSVNTPLNHKLLDIKESIIDLSLLVSEMKYKVNL